MNIIEMQVRQIKPYKKNAKMHDQRQIDNVAESIRQFGFAQPLVVDAANTLIIGHCRLLAAKKLKLKEVPVVVMDELTPAEVDKLRLLDNKLNESSWDYELLESEIAKLDFFNFDIDWELNSDFSLAPNGITAIDGTDEDDGWYGDERERTYNAYNMDQADMCDLTADFWQMPIIHKTDFVPDDLIGFKYVKADNNENAEKAGIHCFIDDYQFERLWNRPDEYIDLVKPYQCMLSPDFSLYTDMNMPTKIWNVYRSRLIGAYYQARGVTVIPTIQWAEPATFEFCFKGIEQGGTIAVSTIGVKEDQDALQIWQEGMKEAIKQLKPKTILVYGGKLDFDYGKIKVVYYENHQLAKWHDDRRAE